MGIPMVASVGRLRRESAGSISSRSSDGAFAGCAVPPLRQILVFLEQRISDDQQKIAFSERFGPPGQHPQGPPRRIAFPRVSDASRTWTSAAVRLHDPDDERAIYNAGNLGSGTAAAPSARARHGVPLGRSAGGAARRNTPISARPGTAPGDRKAGVDGSW